ncbi:MAG: metal-dependent hydrolase [Acidobacteria bacterium]|nr:metal-dependent hydrolase [Acidobacteriota bacterium]MBI3421419.1 metal-dependent hydrolase [Acidobacteriota bacterium]
MPLPIAHGIVGASVILASREPRAGGRLGKALALGAVLGILPDVDLVFAWVLGWGVAVHGGPTHSAFFAVGVGLLVAGWQRHGRAWRAREVWLLSGATFSHGVLDMLVRKDFGGAALYWPFSDEKLRFGLFDYFAFYPGSEPINTVLRRGLEISLYEVLIFTPWLALAALCYALRLRQARRWVRRAD